MTTYKLYANTNPLNKNEMVCILNSDNLMSTNDKEKLGWVKNRYAEVQTKGYRCEIWKETKERVKI